MGGTDDLESELLKKSFSAVDAHGSGKFSREDLAKVFRHLGEWSQDDLDELFNAVEPQKDSSISYAALVDYIMDDEADEEPVEDDEDEDEDHDDTACVAGYEVVGDAHLDLNMYLNRAEFSEVLRRLDVDDTEGDDIFDEVEKEASNAGLPTQAGIKIKWFLDELSIDRKDHEALADLKEAVDGAKAGRKSAGGNHAERIAVARLATHMEKLGKPPEEAWDAMIEHHILSRPGRAAIESKYQGNKASLAAAIEASMRSPPMLPASAGQVANRERCNARVEQLIRQCRAAGSKFVDSEFDVEKAMASCLYVDKMQPGHDCTVGEPAGFKRLSEICEKPVLFKGGVNAGDIKQGHIGTCFLLGALGAIAANKKDAVRRAFLSFDIELGIYGVRFCVDGEWEHVIVDDLVPVDKWNRILYAKSGDPDEVWVSILEKAYCKLLTCYEMADGGRPNQAIFSMCGGSSGKFVIKDSFKQAPGTYFQLLKSALDRGWLLTTTFVVKKGKAGAGKCGEAVLPTGLVGGHVYSVLRLAEGEAGGQQLVCCRNPWGTGEWKGKFSDANANGEWTPELIKATGWAGKHDGKFWMSMEDFVATSGGVEYARTFGPKFKKITQKAKFVSGSLEAKSSWAFTAREKNELTFTKGAVLEVKDVAPGWWFGSVKGTPDVKGFFPANYVKLTDRPVARFDLVGQPAVEGTKLKLVFLLMQPNSKMQRRYYKRKDNGMNYKDISYPNVQLVVLGDDGKVALKRAGKKRCICGELSLEGGRTWRIFALSLDGRGQDFTLRVYAQGGAASLTQVEGASIQDVTEAITG